MNNPWKRKMQTSISKRQAPGEVEDLCPWTAGSLSSPLLLSKGNDSGGGGQKPLVFKQICLTLKVTKLNICICHLGLLLVCCLSQTTVCITLRWPLDSLPSDFLVWFPLECLSISKFPLFVCWFILFSCPFKMHENKHLIYITQSELGSFSKYLVKKCSFMSFSSKKM